MKDNIYTALLQAQKEFPTVKKEDKNPFFKSKYAGLPSVLEVVLPVLNKYEVVMSQSPITEGEKIGIATTLTHAPSGTSLSGSFVVQLAKNDLQGAGSAITYCRRYSLVSMLGLNVDEDDDVNGASGRVPKGVKNIVVTANSLADVLGGGGGNGGNGGGAGGDGFWRRSRMTSTARGTWHKC